MAVTETKEIVERIWARDPTLWTGGDEAEWLGWLDEPLRMQERIEQIDAFAEEVVEEGLDAVVLLGMGGSSLAPEVLKRTFRVEAFHVLDTTHPEAIRRLESSVDLDRTLFITSSKSGSTLETRSHMDYFWERSGGRGARFAAVTDPGSGLEAVAKERGFRAVFPGEPTIGGRYSALSPFGMVPAALMGVSLERLLRSAERMANACRSDANPGLALGLQLGQGWQEGRDKVCIDETDGGFGLWAEQLIAESTGKLGRGLVPAPGENPDGGPDRQRGEVALADPYAVGGEFFRWEFAVAVAGSFLEINPFDQPDVQAAKDKTKEVLASGQEPDLAPEGSVDELFAQANRGDYVCIQAFIDPAQEARLKPLIERARAETGCVVTHGLGPRYLHSTGQLHKGGPNTGVFLQVVDSTGAELPIPGQPFGFGRLIRAQAAGDFASLKERGRRAARVRLEDL
jgi:transaldolase/glucose-6-phosphate isomerase